MSSLYQLSSDFQILYDSLEAIEEIEDMVDDNGDPIDLDEMRQAWFDTLEGLEMEAEDKLEGLAKVYKQITAEAEILSAEVERLKKRITQKKNAAERLETYIKMCMGKLSLKKIDKPGAFITVKNSTPSLKIADDKAFIDWAKSNNPLLVSVKVEEKPNKNAIKKAIKAGEEIPMTELVPTTSISIK